MASWTVGPLPGQALLGSGVAFPEREVSNGEILDLVVRHAGQGPSPHLGLTLKHWALGLAGAVALRRLRRSAPDDASLLRALGLPEDALSGLGVERRRWLHWPGDRLRDAGPHGGDLALQAARAALEEASLRPQDLGALIYSTTTPHRLNSTGALWLGEKLGLQAPCYDLRAGCAGGVHALLHASMSLHHGARKVLVVGAEAYSRSLPPWNRDAIFVAGDGAGAVILDAHPDPEVGLMRGAIGAEPKHDAKFHTWGGLPPTPEAAAGGGYHIQGDPKTLVRAQLEAYLRCIPALLEAAGLEATEVGTFIAHPAALKVVEAVGRRLDLPPERTFHRLAQHGNTGPAGILTAWHEARHAGFIRPGQPLLMAAVGGTQHHGALLWRPPA